MLRALATCALAAALGIGGAVVVTLVPVLEHLTLRARVALAAPMEGPRTLDERIVIVDVRSPVDPERLADVVELARAHGARALALFAEPAPSGVGGTNASGNERLSAAVEECRCVVVPEGHSLAPVSALRGHAVVHDDEAIPRIVLTGKDAGASGAALALALARAAGAPATLEGRADALVRPRLSRKLSVDDIVTPRVNLDRTFRPAAGAALVLVGDVTADALPLHASLLHELMHGALLEPPPRPFTLAMAGVLALLAAIACTVLLRRGRGLVAAAVVIGLGVAMWANAIAALSFDDVWLPLAAPTCALALAYAGAVALTALAALRPGGGDDSAAGDAGGDAGGDDGGDAGDAGGGGGGGGGDSGGGGGGGDSGG